MLVPGGESGEEFLVELRLQALLGGLHGLEGGLELVEGPLLGVLVPLDPVELLLHEPDVGLDLLEDVFGLGVFRLCLLHVRDDPVDLRLDLVQLVTELPHVGLLQT